ncbi:STAS domain-containing protein [Kitasatospora atroaurantiaca]|nr:STAS domain-containing protein [Kitasatospora atroaurantiaca]
MDATRGLQAKLAAAAPQHGQEGCPGLTIDRDAGSGQVTVLTLGGWLDTHSAPELRGEFVTLVDQGQRLLVADLVGVSRLDSVGLGVLVGGLKRLRNAGGAMGVALAESPVLEFLRCCGLTKVFAIHDTPATAAQSLQA